MAALGADLAVHQAVDEGRDAAPCADLHHRGVQSLRAGKLPESKLVEARAGTA